MNAYQDYGGRGHFSLGRVTSRSNAEKVGFVGGLKLGYVFGTGTVRPAIEADLYYNGFKADLTLASMATTWISMPRPTSTAAPSWGTSSSVLPRSLPTLHRRWRGRLLCGIADVEVTIAGRNFEDEGGDNSGFAWQLIGGADYYFTEKSSAFLEYKFLNYEEAGFSGDRSASTSSCWACAGTSKRSISCEKPASRKEAGFFAFNTKRNESRYAGQDEVFRRGAGASCKCVGDRPGPHGSWT